jgi:uncharacterized protein with von Willebrand factor type A (vWA) domain
VGFKTGLLIGAAAGYVLGAKAGRERYEQIRQWLGSAARSERFAGLAEKGKAFAERLPFSVDRAPEG